MAMAAIFEGIDLGTAIAYVATLLGTRRVLPMSLAHIGVRIAIISRSAWRTELKKSLLRSAVSVQAGVCLVLLSSIMQLGALADAGIGLFLAALLAPLATVFLLAKAMSDKETFAFPVSRTIAFFPA